MAGRNISVRRDLNAGLFWKQRMEAATLISDSSLVVAFNIWSEKICFYQGKVREFWKMMSVATMIWARNSLPSRSFSGKNRSVLSPPPPPPLPHTCTHPFEHLSLDPPPIFFLRWVGEDCHRFTMLCVNGHNTSRHNSTVCRCFWKRTAAFFQFSSSTILI